VTHKNALRLIDNERIALVSNFTPAASVTIVDLVDKKVLGEIQTPACSLTFPTGQRGFSTLCGSGAMSTFILNEDGSVKSQSSTEPFNDIDKDALFLKTATVGGITYFPSFTGRIRPVDLSGDKPKILDDWPLVSPDLAKEGWRPGGWQIIDAHPDGSLYILMHPDGREGTHKGGGSEVWVFDPKSKERSARLKLATWGVSLAVTKSDPAYLVVTNANMALDVYSADKGELLRSIGDNLANTPLVVQAHR
jgi:methylamine dehydrogenase heavy chain